MIDDVATDGSSEKSRPTASRRARRVRMTGKERREQLLDIGRALFADKGFEGTSVEEIAARAGVSKPVVYEHFGGKEGLYAVVVDREMRRLLDMVQGALTAGIRGSCWSRRRSRCWTTSSRTRTVSGSWCGTPRWRSRRARSRR
ncbi:hypothetical protein SMICM304S_01925 [Streptomyces microflavus]